MRNFFRKVRDMPLSLWLRLLEAACVGFGFAFLVHGDTARATFMIALSVYNHLQRIEREKLEIARLNHEAFMELKRNLDGLVELPKKKVEVAEA